MKLYDLPRNSKFTIADNPEAGVFLLDHIDGMYSLCYDVNDNVVHFVAWMEVEQQ